MEFFKHKTNARRSPEHRALKRDFGDWGRIALWDLVEYCSEPLKRKDGISLTPDQLVFELNPIDLAKELGCRRKKLEEFLMYLETLSVLYCKFSGNKLEIRFPNLLQSLDRSQKGPRPPRKTAHAELELELEVEREREREGALALQILWNEYRGDNEPIHELPPEWARLAASEWSAQTPDEWASIIKRIAASDFLTGRGVRGRKTPFAWMLVKLNRIKLSTGQYDNSTGKPGNPGKTQLSVVEQARRREAEKVAQEAIEAKNQEAWERELQQPEMQNAIAAGVEMFKLPEEIAQKILSLASKAK